MNLMREPHVSASMIPVRPHVFAGGALLALSALLGLLVSVETPRVPGEAFLVALLGGLGLFAQAIAGWYLPSFAKRRIILAPVATWAGPVLLPLATLAALLSQPLARDALFALGFATFAAIALASALVGPSWRRGIPFWRAPGDFRSGDSAAALALCLSFLWAVAMPGLLARELGLVAGVLPFAAVVFLALFVLGGLAHLVPRSRGRRAWAIVVGAAAAIGTLAGILSLGLAFGLEIPQRLVPFLLLIAIPLGALGIAPPGPAKPAGARMREARGPLLLALLHVVAALVIAVTIDDEPTGIAVALVLLVALVLGMAGLSLLTLPVVFNQRPRGDAILPTLGAAAIGTLALVVGVMDERSAGPGALLLGAALLGWLAVLWPLRRPRRDCVAEPSWQERA